jgi:hypothetical protein
MIVAASARLGQLAEAQIDRLRRLDPTLRVSTLKQQIPLQRMEDLAAFGDALRCAGVRDT